ncbi:hypothetical protein STENM327S_09216 [Streptomyces tendae]
MIVAFLRAVAIRPAMESLIHWVNTDDWLIPRSTWTEPSLATPGIRVTLLRPVVPWFCWYLMTSCSICRFDTELRYSTITPSIWIPKFGATSTSSGLGRDMGSLSF